MMDRHAGPRFYDRAAQSLKQLLQQAWLYDVLQTFPALTFK